MLAFNSDAHSQNVRLSPTLRATLYWQATACPSRAAIVFVHLYDGTGNLLSQQGNTPVNGTYPTNEWDAGVGVINEYALPIPADAPSAKYFLQVGMYDSQTRARLSATDSRGNAFPQDRIPLFEVTR